jgi:hypothetical protein
VAGEHERGAQQRQPEQQVPRDDVDRVQHRRPREVEQPRKTGHRTGINPASHDQLDHVHRHGQAGRDQRPTKREQAEEPQVDRGAGVHCRPTGLPRNRGTTRSCNSGHNHRVTSTTSSFGRTSSRASAIRPDTSGLSAFVMGPALIHGFPAQAGAVS